jgi:hypothetical protein
MARRRESGTIDCRERIRRARPTVGHPASQPSQHRVLRAFTSVSDSAIITTPNRQRTPFTSVERTPAYSEHVREWNAGEFFWVLRAFYRQVDLFTVPGLRRQANEMRRDEGYRPRVERCSDLACEDALIAVCTGVLTPPAA